MRRIPYITFFLILNIALAFTVEIDSTGQRTDGSKLWDIWYTLEGTRDSIDIRVKAITESGEELPCATFIVPSDTGRIAGDGQRHIIWDIDTDVPNREFYTERIKIQLSAAAAGILPGYCFKGCPLAAGSQHTVALRFDGSLWAWGMNVYGQVGDGTFDDRYTPVRVLDSDSIGFLTDIVAVAAGDFHSLALRDDGTVWAWGKNDFGQLGNNTMIDSNIPVQVVGPGGAGYLSEIVAIAADGWHSLALKSNGTVWTWGRNEYGQLGDNTTFDRTYPLQVQGTGGVGFLMNIAAVEAGRYHSVAVGTDGSAWAWGRNAMGELGDNSTIDKHTPVKVLGPGSTGYLTDVISIMGGNFHTVALKSDSTVWAWGWNGHGQLGDNTLTDRHTPVQVHNFIAPGYLTNIVEIAAGRWHSAALMSDGSVWTWGGNDQGQLGVGDTLDRRRPLPVLSPDTTGLLSNIINISSEYSHTMALDSNGDVWGWGWNYFYCQLGNGIRENATVPVKALFPYR